VSLVVEEFPLGKKVVGDWTDGKVGVAKGFDTSTKERILKTEINSSLPNNTANIKRVRTANTDTSFSKSNDVLSSLG